MAERPLRTNRGPIGFPNELKPSVKRAAAIEATVANIQGERLGEPVTQAEREEIERLVDEISGDRLLPAVVPVPEDEI